MQFEYKMQKIEASLLILETQVNQIKCDIIFSCLTNLLL